MPRTAEMEKQLHELFPSMSESICVSVLESKRGDVDEAIDTLLTLADDTEETESDRRKKARKIAIEQRSRERKSAKKRRRRRSKKSKQESAAETADVDGFVEVGDGVRAPVEDPAPDEPADELADEPTEEAATEVEEEAEISNVDQQAASSVVLHPVATVFKCALAQDDADGRANEAAAMEVIMETLDAHDVPPKHVRVVEASTDVELMGFLSKVFPSGGKLDFPLVKIGVHAIGSAAALQAMEWEAVSAVVSEAYSAEGDEAVRKQAADPVYVGRGWLDSCLDAIEYSASLMLWSPFTLVYSLLSSTAKVPESENDVDLDVVHTNWYWRNLRRRFRFGDKHLYRIHPHHGDVRAAHSYETVERIVRQSPTCVTISYNDGSAPDWLHTLPKDCDSIVSLITTRSLPHNVPVVVVAHSLPPLAQADTQAGEEVEVEEAKSAE